MITTATDAHGIFAVDEWAKHQNCMVLEPERIKLVSGKLLAGQPVYYRADFPVMGTVPAGLFPADTPEKADFANIPVTRVPKVKVGVVGEIYVKFSPLGNNRLEEFLLSEGCEPVLPGLMDCCLYCIYNSVIDHELYSRNGKTAAVYKMVYQFVLGKQADIIKMMKKDGHFRPPMPFDEVRKKSHAIIGQGVKMGEGWLLPAEMVELISEGVTNIVCTQPFGCLPNHIVGKGVIKELRASHPEANIIAVDYDPGASEVNQLNRIKLMLSTAQKNLSEGKKDSRIG